MIVLKQTEDAQEVKFIPSRYNLANKLILTNESTNVSIEYDINCTDESFYKVFTRVLELEENHFYEANFHFIDEDINILAHKNRVFCTNQDISDFSVNDNTYVSKPSNIIFYE